MVSFPPKPPAWNLQPGLVHPNWRWFWRKTWAVPFWDNPVNPQTLGSQGQPRLAVSDGSTNPIAGVTEVGKSVEFTVADGQRLTFGNQTFLPTDQVSILMVRKRVDTTTRHGAGFSTWASSGSNFLGALMPFSDNDIYWDFSANSGAGRLIFTGYVPTTDLEVWCFQAGPLGPKIWLDGVLAASSGTASPARVNHATNDFVLNEDFTNFGGHLQHTILFALSNEVWSGQQVIQLSRDPFGPFRKFLNVPYVDPPVFGAGGAYTVTVAAG